MARKSVVTLDTKRLNRILKNLPTNTQNAVGKVAFAVERRAKQKAPVDTGALRASIYTRLGTRKDGFDQAAQAAGGRNADANLTELPAPENETTAHVGPSVEYGPEVEFGTHKKSAQPFLTPAVREVERELAEIFKDVATDGK